MRHIVKSAFACTGATGADRYGRQMRRHLVLAAAIAGLLIVSGCGSNTGTQRTVTAVVTVSSGAVPSGSDAASASPASVDQSAASPSASASATAGSAAP